MLLPYVSYLRVYEPLAESARSSPGGSGDPTVDVGSRLTLAREQRTSLWRAIAPTATVASDVPNAEDCYLMRRGDRVFACPVDLALRSWLALRAFVEDTDGPIRTLFLAPGSDRAADEPAASAWARSLNGVAHVRAATWGVPRTWFLLVEERERETYDIDGLTSARFRTPIASARQRLESAHALLRELIEDEDLDDELTDLRSWLSAFADDCWLEIDYAGTATLLGGALPCDRSAAEIATAMSTLAQRDLPAAALAYRAFVERWRAVNALERAN